MPGHVRTHDTKHQPELEYPQGVHTRGRGGAAVAYQSPRSRINITFQKEEKIRIADFTSRINLREKHCLGELFVSNRELDMSLVSTIIDSILRLNIQSYKYPEDLATPWRNDPSSSIHDI